MEVGGAEGVISQKNVSETKMKTVYEHKLPLDCMWVITVPLNYRVSETEKTAVYIEFHPQGVIQDPPRNFR